MTLSMYKWQSPHEWLLYAFNNGKVSPNELLQILLECVDSDEIQSRFESSMDEDGYFEEITKDE